MDDAGRPHLVVVAISVTAVPVSVMIVAVAAVMSIAVMSVSVTITSSRISGISAVGGSCSICRVGGGDITAPMRTGVVVFPVPVVAVSAMLALPLSLAARSVALVAGHVGRGIGRIGGVSGSWCSCGGSGVGSSDITAPMGAWMVVFPVPVVAVSLVLSLPFLLAASMVALVAGYVGCSICGVGGCDIAAPKWTGMVALPVPVVAVSAMLSLPSSLAARTVTLITGYGSRGIGSISGIGGSDGIVDWESQGRSAKGENANGSEADEGTHLGSLKPFAFGVKR
jgi:hypothetical protein